MELSDSLLWLHLFEKAICVLKGSYENYLNSKVSDLISLILPLSLIEFDHDYFIENQNSDLLSQLLKQKSKFENCIIITEKNSKINNTNNKIEEEVFDYLLRTSFFIVSIFNFQDTYYVELSIPEVINKELHIKLQLHLQNKNFINILTEEDGKELLEKGFSENLFSLLKLRSRRSFILNEFTYKSLFDKTYVYYDEDLFYNWNIINVRFLKNDILIWNKHFLEKRK